MIIRVLYFGGIRAQITKIRNENVEVPEATTVAELLRELEARHVGLGQLRSRLRIAVNEAFVDIDEYLLAPGDEVALVPPVAGGSGDSAPAESRCWLSDQSLDVSKIISAVTAPGYGAVVTFIGLVRQHNEGRTVVCLEYEAYEGMVLRNLADIIRTCEQEYSGARVAIAHRLGKLAVGDIAVVIAAAAPHRASAFDTARQSIELLKQQTPIWKKETSADGSFWIGLTP